MNKEVELLQTSDHKKLYEQFSRAVLGGFPCIKAMPKIPKHYSTYKVSLIAMKFGKKKFHSMSIKFCSYTDGKGTKEILFYDRQKTVDLISFEEIVNAIEKMKKKFEYKDIEISINHDRCIQDLQENKM